MLRALILEDSPKDVEIIRELLIDAGFDLDMDCTALEKEFVSLLRSNTYDVILADFKLPGFDGFGALKWAMEICPNVPFICVSGTIGEETAVELLKLGAVDYILKDRPIRLPSAIKRALVEAKEKETQRWAEEELRKSELRFKQVLESAHEWVWEVDKNGLYTYVSPVIKELLGYEADELVGIKYFYDFFDPGNKEEMKQATLGAFARKESLRNFINCNIHKDGRKIILSTTGFPILDAEKNLIGYRGADVDITERKRMEESLMKQKDEFETIFNLVPAQIWYKGIHNNFIRVNNQGCTDIGMAKDQIEGHNAEQLFPSFAQQYFNDDLEVINTRKPKLGIIEQTNTANGEIRWVHTEKIPVFGNNGEANGLIVFVQDITERKRAEEEFALLAHSLRSINECVSITDLEHNIQFVNESFLKTYGYDENELVGKHINIVRSQNNPPELVKEILPATKHGGWKGELWNKRKDGNEFLIYLSTTIINDKDGKPLGLIGVAQDITERRCAEKELIEAKQKAEESDKLKTEFLAQMSHEIRTPLNAIVGNADYLNDVFGEKMDANTRDCVASINLASERMMRTVDLILNAAELQTSGYKPQFVKVDLNSEILNKLYQEHQLSAKQKGLEFIYTFKEKDAKVIADEYSTIQIFANLIDNAIKYTKQGKVEILLGKNNMGKIIVEVKDTGIGISKEFLPRIFEPFTQEDQGFTRNFEGNGLGLALVKGYCELNNAIIEVESEKNVGSTFRVIFD